MFKKKKKTRETPSALHKEKMRFEEPVNLQQNRLNSSLLDPD